MGISRGRHGSEGAKADEVTAMIQCLLKALTVPDGIVAGITSHSAKRTLLNALGKALVDEYQCEVLG